MCGRVHYVNNKNKIKNYELFLLGFVLSSLVTHHRLSSIKEITLSSFQNSTKLIEDAIQEHSDEILTQTSDIKSLLGKNQPLIIEETVGGTTRNSTNEANQQENFEKLLVPILERLDKLSLGVVSKSENTVVQQPIHVAQPSPQHVVSEEERVPAHLHDTEQVEGEEDIVVSSSDPPPAVQYTPLVLVVSAAALLLYSMMGQS